MTAFMAVYVFINIICFILTMHFIPNAYGMSELNMIISIIFLSQHVLQIIRFGYQNNHPSCFVFPFKLKH